MNEGDRAILALYVAEDCRSCEAALAVAERARREFPDVAVHVIDLDVPSARLPAGVFAVPTFVLNDHVVSLGTPSWDHLSAALRDTSGREPS